jgi:hypothetical protein
MPRPGSLSGEQFPAVAADKSIEPRFYERRFFNREAVSSPFLLQTIDLLTAVALTAEPTQNEASK